MKLVARRPETGASADVLGVVQTLVPAAGIAHVDAEGISLLA